MRVTSWFRAILLIVALYVADVGVVNSCGGESGDSGFGWSEEIETAFLEGCMEDDENDPDLPRFCTCLLVELKKAGKTPADVVDLRDPFLHKERMPSWVVEIVADCW